MSLTLTPSYPGGSSFGGPYPLLGSHVITVDGSRTDTYIQTGSVLTPFKTIMQAVNLIVANGDNATIPYTISVAAGAYMETVDLSNPALANVALYGYGVTLGNPVHQTPVFNSPRLQAINNDNLSDCLVVGFTIVCNGTETHAVQFCSTTQGTNLGIGFNSVGIKFVDCNFPGNTADLYVNNAGYVRFQNCGLTVTLNVTNVNDVLITGYSGLDSASSFNLNADGGTPTPSGWNGTGYSNIDSTTVGGTITVGAGTELAITGAFCEGDFIANGVLAFANCIVGNLFNNPQIIVVNSGGILLSALSFITSTPITVKSGGVFIEDGGVHDDGELTVESGGAYTGQGDMGLGTLALSEHLNAVQGNPDLAGTISINSGSYVASFTFENAFVSEPVVVVTPLNDVTANGPYWVTASPTGFSVMLHTSLSSGSVTFNYIVVGNPN